MHDSERTRSGPTQTCTRPRRDMRNSLHFGSLHAPSGLPLKRIAALATLADR